jgi:hypothetical protein
MTWRTTGNAGTDPANNLLGTTDNQALEVQVNNRRAAHRARRHQPQPDQQLRCKWLGEFGQRGSHWQGGITGYANHGAV